MCILSIDRVDILKIKTIGCLFEKCNNSNYKLRSNGKFLRLSKPCKYKLYEEKF
jgi:hypothetical protein